MKTQAVRGIDFTEECRIFFAHEINFDGFCYRVVFGWEPFRGAFIHLPDFKILCMAAVCEGSTTTLDEGYCIAHLVDAGVRDDIAETIVWYIADVFEKMPEECKIDSVEQFKRMANKRGYNPLFKKPLKIIYSDDESESCE